MSARRSSLLLYRLQSLARRCQQRFFIGILCHSPIGMEFQITLKTVPFSLSSCHNGTVRFFRCPHTEEPPSVESHKASSPAPRSDMPHKKLDKVLKAYCLWEGERKVTESTRWTWHIRNKSRYYPQAFFAWLHR